MVVDPDVDSASSEISKHQVHAPNIENCGDPYQDEADFTKDCMDYSVNHRIPDCEAAYEPLLGRGAEFLTPSVHWEEGVLTVTTPTGCSHRVWNRSWLNDTPLCTNVYLTFYRKRLRNI